MRNRLYIPINAQLPDDLMMIQQVLVHDFHDPSTIGGYLGVEKTLEKLTISYY